MLEKLVYGWPLIALLSFILAVLFTKSLVCGILLNIFIVALIGTGLGYAQAYLKKICKDGEFKKINIILSILFGIIGGIFTWL